jgi:hypothetical protein
VDESTEKKDSKAEERARRDAENRRILAEKSDQYDGRVTGYPVGRHGILIVKFADRTHLKFFRKKVAQAQKDANDDALDLLDEQLVIGQAVYPETPEAVKAILEDYPVLAAKASREIINLSGDEIQPLGKD